MGDPAAIPPAEAAPGAAASPDALYDPARHRPAFRHWWMVVVLAIITILSWVDRNALNLLAGEIKRDLALSDTQLGLLLGAAFALFYAFAGLPAGHLSDRLNRRLLLGAGMVLWTLMTFVSGLAGSFGLLFLARTGVGLGEAVLSPIAASLIRSTFGPEYRARAFGILAIAQSTGGGIALLIVGAAASWAAGLPDGSMHDWQIVLMLVGLGGMPLALLLLTFREPPRQPVAATARGPGVRAFLATMAERKWIFYPFFLAQMFSGIGAYAFAAWMPTAIARSWSLTPAQVGASYGTVQIAGAITGLFIGTILMDRLTRRHGLHAVAISGAGFSFLAAVGTVIAPLVQPIELVWLALGLHWLAIAPAGAAAATMLAGVTPAHMTGRATAVSYLALSLLGYGIGPSLVAFVSESLFVGPDSIGYSLAIVSGCSLTLAGLLKLFVVGRIRRVASGRMQLDD